MVTADSVTPAKLIRPQPCTNLDCDDVGAVVVADGVLLCSRDALKWYERERPRGPVVARGTAAV